MNETERLVRHIEHLTHLDIPDGACNQVKRCFMDYVGCLYAGAKGTFYKQSVALAQLGPAKVFGFGVSTDPLMASLLNGVHSHAVELDDGHRKAMIHLAAPIFSAMIAAYFSSSREIDDEHFILGAVCGYQTAIILAETLQPAHKMRGYHGTGTCGTVAAAVAIAVMYGYSKDQLSTSIAMAATSGSGLLELIDDGSQLKPYNIGRAAMDGCAAALCGSDALQTPKDVIGGKRGFIEVLSGQSSQSVLPIPTDGRYLISEIYMKPYAACRHCHPSIEAAERIISKHHAAAVDIQSVEVRTYNLAVFGHDDTHPTNVSAAKMSTPYGVAAMLLGHGAGIHSYSDDILNQKMMRDLMEKIAVVEDAEVTSWLPERRGSTVRVTMADGTIIAETVEFPKGEPENPLTQDEVQDKFRRLCLYSGYLDDNEIRSLEKAICEGKFGIALGIMR